MTPAETLTFMAYAFAYLMAAPCAALAIHCVWTAGEAAVRWVKGQSNAL